MTHFGELQTEDPFVLENFPLSMKILVIAIAIFLGPYLIIQAWREERREA